MKTTPPNSHDRSAESKRQALFDAAIQVFSRLGYRKASMDEVARLAQISRQGLYLHFANKEHLFRASVCHWLDQALAAATACLSDSTQSLEDRLLGAFDQWLGCAVGLRGGDLDELIATTHSLLGSVIDERTDQFQARLEQTFAASPELLSGYERRGITAHDLARNLSAAAIGYKHSSRTRDEFRADMSKAIAIVCLPCLETIRPVP